MTNSQTPNPFLSSMESESLDFKRYISLFLSNWYWFAIALFISMSISYSINRWSEKFFTVSSTLIIKDDKFAGAGTEFTNIFPGTNSFRSQQNLKNEIGVLRSFKLSYRAIRELPEFHVEYIAVGKRGIVESKIYNRCPFKVEYDSLNKQKTGEKVSIKIISGQKYRLEIPEINGYFREKNFGDEFREMGYDFKISLRNPSGFEFDHNASNKYYFYFNNPVSLANIYRNKIVVSPVEEDASLVTLSVSGFVPQQEADYLNKLMDVYIDYGLEVKNQTASQTIEFIDEQLAQISDSLKKVEGNLQSFKLANKLIDISSEGSMIQKKLEKVETDQASLRLQENYYNYLNNYIDLKTDSKEIISPSIMGITDQLLVKLVDELSGLQEKKRMMNMNFNDTTTPLILLERNISTVHNSLKENVGDGLKNIEKEKQDVYKRLADLEIEIQKLPSTERQMINIQRKFDIYNTVYTFLLEKRAEAGIAKASNVSDNRTIDYAGSYNSSMIRPNERKNYLVALILGLLFPGLGILVIDYLNNKIIDKSDIEKKTSVPILGYLSHNNLKTEIPVSERPGSTLAESFRSVRTNLKYFINDIRCPVIAVSSTISAEGKTFVSANLATIIASNSKKVLLLGLDLRRPKFHEIFESDNRKGITSYLIGEEKFENIVFETTIKNLWYAPSGPVPPNPAELIDSGPMKELIEKAKTLFDFIIIDTPPIAIVTDALLISPLADFYLFIVRQRYSSRNTLELIEELNKNKNIGGMGIVINDINLSGYYGYGLRYGYSLGYGYNYGYNYYSRQGKYGYTDSAKSYYAEES